MLRPAQAAAEPVTFDDIMQMQQAQQLTTPEEGVAAYARALGSARIAFVTGGSAVLDRLRRPCDWIACHTLRDQERKTTSR